MELSLTHQNPILAWSAACLLIALTGCGGKPSDTELVSALTSGDPLIGLVYEIRDIRRVNGYERPSGYVIEYSATLHILESPQEYFTRLRQGGISAANLASVAESFEMAKGGLAKWGLKGAALISASKKGDDIPFSGSVNMIKSERGWIARAD